MKNLERIDAENEEFYSASYQNVVTGKYSIKDILGFDLKEPKVFIPRTPCAHIGPSVINYCNIAGEKPTTSILTLLPLYNTLIYPISSEYQEAKTSQAIFEEANDISLKDFLAAVMRGKIIPCFTSDYGDYDVDFVQHFLEPGVPRISFSHMQLVNRLNACKFTNGNCKACNEIFKTAKKDITAFGIKRKKSGCAQCLLRAYEAGLSKETLLKTTVPRQTLCAVREILTSRNVDAAFETNCPRAIEALGLFMSGSGIAGSIDEIVKGLRVKYTRDLDFGSYLELLDEKTTRALREIIQRILDDPFAAKHSDRLSSKIFEFNREVEEVATSKTAKFYHAVSDIAVYGGSKYIERKTEGYLRLGKKRSHKTSEWIASKLMDVHAKATGKDWTIAQLYRTRMKLDQCKKRNAP